MSIVQTGLERLINEDIHKKYKGNIGVLCHSASINSKYEHIIPLLLNAFGKRLKKIFGPQHGLVTDVQDNMVETDHFTHPYYKLPVYSLYSETRIPTDEMLKGIDHLFIDLQDVGTRIYTYIYTMTYILEKCSNLDIDIIILDRPNPINCQQVEGNILDLKFASFVGRHELPVRHGLTIAEAALMHQKYFFNKNCKLEIISMKNYHPSMYFEDTKLPWVLPSPNLPSIESCLPFVGTVLFEGTNISEGRGSTKSLEIIGHPKINPWEFLDSINSELKATELTGFYLRPMMFMPMFQKHANKSCGGFQIHVTDRSKFQPWRLCQFLMQKLVQTLQNDFSYKKEPYEYEEEMNPVDMINGDDRFRLFYEKNLNYEFLNKIENEGLNSYLEKKSSIKLY